jgi:prepilin-type N-terminal cleavage/methylation domain-containing protein
VTTRRDAGFTLVEVMLVVCIIGTLASIAIPGIVRARAAAMEVSTIESLRAIHSAQVAFQGACGAGFYAPSISWLATTSRGAQPFIGPEFSANTTDRLGYRIRFSAGTRAAAAPRTCNGLRAGLGVTSFFVGADLLAARSGVVTRYFGVNQSGVIYQSTRRVAPFYTGVPRRPARPIE